MKEQEVYKEVLTDLIAKTEQSEIESSKEFVQTLIQELNHYNVVKPNNA